MISKHLPGYREAVVFPLSLTSCCVAFVSLHNEEETAL